MAGTYWTDRAKISLKTHIVLELVDNFKNQLIQPCHMQFYMDDTPTKATRNKNGLLVFCNLLAVPSVISIVSDLFQKRTIKLSELEKDIILNGGYIHRQVRLEPSKRYVIPSWGTVIEGQVENIEVFKEENRLECIVEAVADRYRIKKDSSDNQSISIHMTNQDIMVGRQFFDVDGQPSESFTVTDVEGDDFKVNPDLNAPLEAHSQLQEIKSIYVDTSGYFMIVYPKVSEPTAGIKLYKDKEKVGEFQIKSNSWNNLGIISV